MGYRARPRLAGSIAGSRPSGGGGAAWVGWALHCEGLLAATGRVGAKGGRRRGTLNGAAADMPGGTIQVEGVNGGVGGKVWGTTRHW